MASRVLLHGGYQGVRRPSGLSARTSQDVALLRDASGSMCLANKAVDASAASLGLLAALRQPENKDGFRIGVIDFGGDAATVHPMTRVSMVQTVRDILPFSWSTDIGAALRLGHQLLRASGASVEEGWRSTRPVALVFSDGWHNGCVEPVAEAAVLRTFADVVTIAFGSDADEELLTKIASSPAHFYRCRDGGELRRFLANVGATLSQSLRGGGNATVALSKIRS